MKMLAKLTPEATASLFSLQSRAENLTRLFLIALGYVLAGRATLPGERVDDANAYFRLQHEYQIRTLLGEINELLVFDMDQALALVKSFYAYRCTAWSPAPYPVAINEGQGVYDFFGIAKHFALDDLEIINKDAAKLSNTVALLNEIVKAMSAHKAAEAEKYQ